MTDRNPETHAIMRSGASHRPNKGLSYPALDARIGETYAKASNARLHKNLYDSYIRAIRWASDRVKDRGVVGFVTNGSFIDANNMDGLRGCLTDEFTSLYVFNLRGNARTQGEARKKEKGNVFGGGTRTPVAITLLVKNPAHKGKTHLHYHDIGNYLSRDDKLRIVRELASVDGIAKAKHWRPIKPNAEHDWINQRDPAFDAFIPLGDKDNSDPQVPVFESYSLGVVTNRDAWVYNMSSTALKNRVTLLIDSYQQEMSAYQSAISGLPKAEGPTLESVVDSDPARINWTRSLKADARRGKPLKYEDDAIRVALYRPFSKRWMYFSRRLNEMVYQMPAIFPTPDHPNLVIPALGSGASHDFSTLIADTIVDLEGASGSRVGSG